MNLTGRPISIAYAILLAGCAWLAWRQMLGMGFGMGESVGGIGLVGATFLIVTALGIAGLALASLGSWTQYPFFSLIAMAGVIGVLPEALIFLREPNGIPIWQWNDPQFAAPGALVFVLDLLAGLSSWLRFRQLVHKSPPPTLPLQG